MRQRNLFLSVVFLAGTCVGIAPAWSQTQPSERPSGGRSSDELKSPPSAAKQSGGIKSEGQVGGAQQGATEREGRASGSPAAAARAEGQADVKKIQEALKEKGHDPGPIDGIMGQRTREALRSFQQSNNLKPTGRIDAQTAKELGVEHEAGVGTGQQRSGVKPSKQGMGEKSEQRSPQGAEKGSTTR